MSEQSRSVEPQRQSNWTAAAWIFLGIPGFAIAFAAASFLIAAAWFVVVPLLVLGLIVYACTR